MKYRYFLLLTFYVLFAVPVCSAQPKTEQVTDSLIKKLSADLVTDNVQGSMSVCIIKDKEVLWKNAVGFVNRKEEVPADTNTIYRIGSITKTFTAVLMMMLVEEGKIKLDDPVDSYLPEIRSVKGYSEPVTFRQLASHTSGLKREPDLRNATVGPLELWDVKLMECLAYTSFDSKPNTKYLYSNIGYAILGLALSHVAGKPYIEMVQQKIFAPLQMNNTFFSLPEDKRKYLAQGISNESGRINTAAPLKELEGRGYKVPNGGIFSTPSDLAKFVMSFTGKPALLSAASVALMTKPAAGNEYGLGLELFNKGDIHIVGHGGSVSGYTAQFELDRSNGYGMIIMRNYNAGATGLFAVCTNTIAQLSGLSH